jgi:hypothetical protein
LEVPVVETCQVLPVEDNTAAASRYQGETELGQLVVRLINIAKQPSNVAAQAPDFNAAALGVSGSGACGKRVSLITCQVLLWQLIATPAHATVAALALFYHSCKHGTAACIHLSL